MKYALINNEARAFNHTKQGEYNEPKEHQIVPKLSKNETNKKLWNDTAGDKKHIHKQFKMNTYLHKLILCHRKSFIIYISISFGWLFFLLKTRFVEFFSFFFLPLMLVCCSFFSCVILKFSLCLFDFVRANR